jgi:predicted DNA-binding protein
MWCKVKAAKMISVPLDIYQTLEVLAKQKKVSLAWVVREAAERYVADESTEGREGQRQINQGTGKLIRRTK